MAHVPIAGRNVIRENGKTMVLGFAVLMMSWISLTRSVDVASIAMGAVCCVLVIVFWHQAVPVSRSSAHRILLHPLRSLCFVGVLAYRFVLSTLYTAWMILRRGEEGRIVALPLGLEDPFARFILLNSITLTPSTISLLTEEGLLYIHWLQSAQGEGDWQGIKESLELRLARVFEPSQGGRHGDR